MEFTTIKFEKKAGYAIITLNRPDKLNALNNQLFTDLDNAISALELDTDIRALLLTGEGKAFAAGADIKELNTCDGITGKDFSAFGSNVMARLEALRIPVLAAVNGFALGGGCELAMACHIRYASNNAKMGQPEVNLGILPGYGGTQRLTRLVGVAKSMELNLSGDMVSAEEAKRIGLVNEVYDESELIEKSIAFIEKVISKSPIAVSAIIDSVRASTTLSLKEGLEYESQKFGEVCGSQDFKEGTLAFLEKRKANFIGK
ncbi:MAG: enoyl-CoA hydratase-related protein [Candidatus Kapaibacterium sp.]